MSIVDEIKQRLDAVEVIGGYVPLQKAGRTYKGLCPFHTEKTPSFIVFPDSGTWHCFGACATGGDIFTFVMRREGVDFPEALRMLAERAGVELHPLDSAELELKDELERLRAVNAAAAGYWHRVLLEGAAGEPGRQYLARRGVTRETMAAFQLGFAVDGWHTLDEHLRGQKYAPADLLDAGLTIRNDAGNVYDRFRGRLMFPIRDVQGHIIGFAGRVLDSSLPKYMNTPQTALFDKGSVLYGIDLARETIRESGTAIVVEGYMDVIVPHQCGVRNLVAVMGTALTEAHMKTLKRITKRLILALDPDAAGMHATEKGVSTAQQHLERKVVPVLTASGLVRFEDQLDAEIRVLTLPDGLDPDELILKDRTRWDDLVENALPVADYFFGVVLGQEDVSTAKGKREAADRLLPVIAAMDNPVERTHYLQRLAQRLRVDERQLQPAVARLRGGSASPMRAERGSAPTPPTGASNASVQNSELGLEERFVALLLHSPGMLPEVLALSELTPDALEDVRNRQVFVALQKCADDPAGSPPLEGRLDSELYGHVESLLQSLQSGPPLSAEMVREDLLKCSTRLKKSYLSRLIRDLRFVLQDAQDDGNEAQLREMNALIDGLTRDYHQIDRRSYAATFVGRKQR
ncbi:MAG: DNA primase [Anaerolineae bacterium]